MKTASYRLHLWFGIFSLVVASLAQAGPGRTAVNGVPRINGREIEQFVLMDYIRMKSAVNAGLGSSTSFVMLPGQFVAVSEDGGGVYYQAVNAFRMAKDPNTVIVGGVYVARTGSSSMTAYFGDARNQGVPVRLLNHVPMITEDMKKFQVAKSSAVKTPKK